MNLQSWVKLFNAAASESEGLTTLILSQSAGTPTSHLAYEGENPSNAPERVTVPTITLDKLVERGEIRPPQFIKVDVEGHGGKALRGANQTIATHHPTIAVSFHSRWEVEGTRELLEPKGYRSFTCEGLEIDWPASDFRGTAVFCC